ncbi:hypothetical protein ACFX13_015172 [Malus domestica]
MVMMRNSSNSLIMLSYVFMITMMIFLLKPNKRLVNAGQNDIVVLPNFCTTRLNVLQPPYHDIPKSICSSLDWHGYRISFFQDNNAVLTVVLSGMNENSWVGVGVSKDGMMVGSSAVVGWMNRDGRSGTVKQYYLKGRTRNDEIIPDKGELKFTNVTPTIVVKDQIIYLGFQLQFSSRLDRQPFLFAAGYGKPGANNILPTHKYRSALLVDFPKGVIRIGFVDSRKVKMTHGILTIIGWGIIIPFGASMARYLREYEPLWYYLHSSVQFIGFFVGLSGVAVGRTLYELVHADFNSHRSIGYIVLALSVLQLCQFIMRPSRTSKVRKYWNKSHQWVGRSVVVLALVNIFIGLFYGNGGKPFKTFFLCAFSLFVLSQIILEIRHLLQRKRAALATTADEPPLFQVPPRT